MNALAHSYFFWLFLIRALLGLYILPTAMPAALLASRGRLRSSACRA
jgi:hypothetical protein